MDDPTPQDSALRQIESDPASRKKFLKMVGAGGAGALALLVAACGDDAERSSNTGERRERLEQHSSGSGAVAQFGKGDVGIVKYALTLEYLEADFYKQAAESGMLKGDALELGKVFGEHEQEHVDALEATLKKLGGKLPRQAEGQVPARLAGRDPRPGRDRREPRRRRLPGPGGQDQGQGSAGRRAVDPLGRGAPRVGAQPGARQAGHPRRRFAKPASMDEVLKQVKPYIAS